MSRIAGIQGYACLVAAVLLLQSLALAGPDERIAAEALFDEGKSLMIEGKLAVACEKLEQSQRIDPAVGTLLYLAECYEKSGRTAGTNCVLPPHILVSSLSSASWLVA